MALVTISPLVAGVMPAFHATPTGLKPGLRFITPWKEAVAPPRRVVTTGEPVVAPVMTATRWFALSATYTLPAGSTATPIGWLKAVETTVAAAWAGGGDGGGGGGVWSAKMVLIVIVLPLPTSE